MGDVYKRQLQRDASLVYRGGCRAEMERHSMLLMEPADETPDLWSQDFLHRYCLGPDHMHFDIPGTERGLSLIHI